MTFNTFLFLSSFFPIALTKPFPYITDSVMFTLPNPELSPENAPCWFVPSR